MADLPEIISVGLLAYASKDLIKAVLGPTAEFLGQETRGLVEKCNINLSNVFKVAYRKLSGKEESKGRVNLRVFKEVVSEGKFSDDPICQEYYGGILAASKTSDGSDDRGVYYLSVIRDLSSVQLRLHYLAYLKVAYHFHSYKEDRLETLFERQKVKIHIQFNTLSLVFKEQDADRLYNFCVHAMVGLREKQLIAEKGVYVDGVYTPRFSNIEGRGLVVTPTLLGCELFLWGNGISNVPGSHIGRADLTLVQKIYNTGDIVITTS